ncbi:MAG: hypothetical protein ACRDAM_09125 [Casimicrobium sp.]
MKRPNRKPPPNRAPDTPALATRLAQVLTLLTAVISLVAALMKLLGF